MNTEILDKNINDSFRYFWEEVLKDNPDLILFYKGVIKELVMEYAEPIVIDAVEFAEWINNNAYSQYYGKGDYKKWYRRSLLSDGGFLTSQELYEIFKSEKPQITSK